MPKTVTLNGRDLTIPDVVAVARHNVPVEIAPEARAEICRVRNYIEENWLSPEAPPVYGFNTGVGKLKDFNIDMDQKDIFQNNIVMSHCGCVGEPAPEEVVRATMLVRLNAFCLGFSGLRIQVVDRLLEMLNKGVHPVIPYQGSVGACGDLGPLAHMTSVLIGYEKAEAFYRGRRLSAPDALQQAGIFPSVFQLKAKDCLALINGTTMFTGLGALNCYDALELARTCDVAGAMSLEAVRGETAAFDPRVHKARLHKGQEIVASNILKITSGSTRVSEDARKIHLPHDIMHPSYQPRVQDLYSLRCIPQVHGAVRDNLQYAWETIEREINAATDNPLVFWDESGEKLDFLSCGNFHGEPVAFAMDIVAISLAELGNISERRSFFLCDPTLNYGLSPMLAGKPVGLNCGYPVISCAAAALASENKGLCFPASVDTIPTKSNQEDHVSILKNLEKIIGIEFLLASHAISSTEELLGEFKLGVRTAAVINRIRQDLRFVQEDHYMPGQSEPCILLTEKRELLVAVESAIGNLA
ncbi:MAG: histidine ammonia-lyase [Dethiosulfovibrio peptidovorans]|nr:MAG: histidine ammonia-lyase [Dethiosulfovibrio peptidovorans]